MIAEILINENTSNLNKLFDYRIPEIMEEKIKIGSVVKVIFNKRKITGFVLNIKEKTKLNKLNNIIEILENDDLDENRIKLAKMISIKYFANLNSCLKLFLNPGFSKSKSLKKQKENIYILEKEVKELLKEIENFNFKNVKKEIKEKYNINISINHFKILEYFKNENIDMQYEKILIEDIDISKNILNTCVKNNILKKEEIEVVQNIYKYNDENKKKLKLNSEQEMAFNKIIEAINNEKFKEFLLFGVTGSGKTEIYMQVIEETIKKGKSAIMLVPEIGLTPQMEKVFSKRFGSNISIMHSRLTKRERYDEWQNIKNGEKKIIIGTRSAIFSPIKNIGVIIIDEEHDKSYISGNSPRYDVKDIARYIANSENAVYIKGSATPLITSMYDAKNRNVELLELKNRVSSLKLPEVEIVDMRTSKNMFSEKLIEYLKENIEKEKQSLIFLNRRGFSNIALCKACGYMYRCPNCSVNITYHKRENAFKCHYCGYTEKNTGKCKNCGSDISFIGYGTQKVKEELEKKLKIKSIIMDQDSVNLYGGHKDIINEFINKKRDVLIGTQMIAKGHHFPNVNLVSVLLADNILNSENYEGSEIAFQTLVQVIGRAGREENGKALIQTYNPDNYIIDLAKKNDYYSFYNLEIALRKNLNYPPFTDILTFQIVSNKDDVAEKVGYELLYKLRKYKEFLKENLIEKKLKKLEMVSAKEKYINKYKEQLDKIEIYDLMPYRINKINNIYRWKIVMKAKLDLTVMNWIKDIIKSIKLPAKTNINLIINNFE